MSRTALDPYLAERLLLERGKRTARRRANATVQDRWDCRRRLTSWPGGRSS